jgi:hypothetical protein
LPTDTTTGLNPNLDRAVQKSGSFHPETSNEKLLVSDLETRDLSSWQETFAEQKLTAQAARRARPTAESKSSGCAEAYISTPHK